MSGLDFVILHENYIPRRLSPGVLYVSREYETASHMCACGCGREVVTPLSPGEWTLTENEAGPTLSPSIGNAKTCGSHYWIRDGKAVRA